MNGAQIQLIYPCSFVWDGQIAIAIATKPTATNAQAGPMQFGSIITPVMPTPKSGAARTAKN